MATIYHYPTSHCSRKVRMVAAELGLPHETVVVDIATCENYYPDYSKNINPGMVVPAFVDFDGETVVVDSKVIMETLVAKYTGAFNDTDLRPHTPEEMDTAKEWLDRMDTLDIVTISMGSGKYIPPFVVDLRYAKALRLTKMYADQFAVEDPPLAELYWKQHERIAKASAKSGSREEMKVALDRLKSDVKDMDALLFDGRLWLCGDRLTLVDVAWAPVFRRLEDIGYSDEVLSSLLNVQRYASELKKRPSYVSAIDGFPPQMRSPIKKVQVVCNLVYDKVFGGKETNIMIIAAGIGVAIAATTVFRKKK